MNEIDSLKKRVAELEKANRELDDVFNALEDLVFVIDKDNIVTRVNNAFSSFLKTKPQNIIGKKCHDLVHVETRANAHSGRSLSRPDNQRPTRP